MRHIISCAWLAILLLLARSGATADPPRQPGFADWCYQQALYTQAHDAFLKELWESTVPAERDSLRLQVALCRYQMQDYPGVLDWFRIQPAETAQGACDAGLQSGLTCMEMQDFEEARLRFNLGRACPDTRDAALFHEGRTLACLLDTVEARKAWSALGPGSPFAGPSQQLLLKLDAIEVPDRRSPLLAGLYASVPGLGYAYSGHHQTAISALLVLGGLGWATERGFTTGNAGMGSFFGFILLGWYTGSIHGSVQAAGRFNEVELDRYRSQFN